MSAAVDSFDPNWWRQAVVYQIYPRSFADSNGDGIGDLNGITSKIPYLQSINVDAVWLSPFYPSPLKDGGYDVSDYRNVDPNIGTLDDFDNMMRTFTEAGIKVIVDIVPNHCSEEHPWFQEALTSPKGSEARARFHFRDGKGVDKSQPPNEWTALWSASLWEPVGDGQFYFHMFDKSQPDLNWDNESVQDDFLSTLRFWGDRGVSGFRVDVAQALAKDLSEPFMTQAEIQERSGWLRTNGKTADYTHSGIESRSLRSSRSGGRSSTNTSAVGEIMVSHDRVPLYASPEGLGQAFAFDIQKEPYDARAFRATIESLYNTARAAGSTTTWVLSNHDVVRHATRYGAPKATEVAEKPQGWNDSFSNELLLNKGIEVDAALGLQRAKATILLLLGLPGSTYMYQGEELGLPEVINLPDDKRQDPIFTNGDGTQIGRDGCRVPIPWDESSSTYGFSPESASREPWLPIPEWFKRFTAERQNLDEESTLNLYRKALRIRKAIQDSTEIMSWVGEPSATHLRFKRPGGWQIVMNMNEEQGVDLPAGRLLVSSGPVGDGKIPPNTTVWVMSDAE